MVFAAMYRQKPASKAVKRASRRALPRAYTRGHAEADAAWREWNDRRLAAEANGQPFGEPPPDFRNGSGSSAGFDLPTADLPALTRPVAPCQRLPRRLS